MSSNINQILCFLILLPALLFSQASLQDTIFDHTSEDYRNYIEDPETVFLEIGIFRPIGVGNSVFGEAYSYKSPGFEIDFNWFVVPEITVGAKIDYFNATVHDKYLTGEISRTGITSISAHLGYYKAFNREWNWHVSAGIGHLYYYSRAPEDKFTEEGTNVFLQNEVAYRFTKNVAIYGKVNLRNDVLRIDTTKEYDSYFNKHTFLTFGFGLRINLQNPGG